MVQIIPAILSTTENDFKRDVFRLEQSSLLQEGWVHIDFMDNIFVPNKSIRPSSVAKYPVGLHKEAHLMVIHPLEWIDDLVQAGFEKIIFHIESEDEPVKCIEHIKEERIQVGIAINNETPIEKLEPFLNKVDVVLVMAVVPGFQGQKFIPATLGKIKEVSLFRSEGNWNFRIGVDGAIKNDNIKDIIKEGADFVIVGSYLLKGEIEENLENLWEALG